MDSTMCIGNLRYTKEKLPLAKIDKILAILDNDNFGVKREKDLERVVKKVQKIRENTDVDRSE